MSLQNPHIDSSLIYMIPGWIYRAMQRNKFNIIDAVDYTRLRQIVSVNDLAELMLLNKSVPANPLNWVHGSSYDSRPDLFSIFENYKVLKPAEISELTTTIEPMTGLPEIAKGLQIRLSLISDGSVPLYKIIPSSSSYLFVIVEEGLVKALDDHDYKLSFMRAILQLCYSNDTIATVSKSELFKRYLQLLKVTA